MMFSHIKITAKERELWHVFLVLIWSSWMRQPVERSYEKKYGIAYYYLDLTLNAIQFFFWNKYEADKYWGMSTHKSLPGVECDVPIALFTVLQLHYVNQGHSMFNHSGCSAVVTRGRNMWRSSPQYVSIQRGFLLYWLIVIISELIVSSLQGSPTVHQEQQHTNMLLLHFAHMPPALYLLPGALVIYGDFLLKKYCG